MLRLRPYKKGEGEKIASWISSEQEFIFWSAGKLGAYPATADTLEELADRAFSDPKVFPVVACDDDNPVGFCVLGYPSDDRRHMNIEFVIIDPAVRGRGFGMGMLDLSLKYCFDILKAKRVSLEAFKENDGAFKMYLSTGFTENGNIIAYDISGQKYDRYELEVSADNKTHKFVDSVVPEDNLIRDIISGNKFNYAFQPIVDASSGEIYGYEALMRADFGVNVSPMTILDFATRENKLYDIERCTLFNVMDLYEKRKSDFMGRKLFINSIPGFQLSEKDYGEFLEKYRGYLDQIIIEITENTEFKGEELSILLERSSRDGFELAIDDYGTGYSNTASLLTYTPAYIKIDRLLIADIHEDTKKQHFVKNIIEFAAANGVKTLAEGVETGPELKTVIELGVDYIQGFYTARPTPDIVESIDDDVIQQIISSSVKSSNQEVRKIYTSTGEEELPIMRLALEKYTGILVDQPALTLVGNTGYSADMSIKIKDGTKCRLTMRDVFIESVHQLPCVEIGQNAELMLVLEGDNRMVKYGILVPDSAKLVIAGDGNLQIRSQGVSSYAIGNFWNAGVGDIKWKGTGSLDILVEADEGIGIGGGEFKPGTGISLLSGIARIEPASGRAIAVGSVKGAPPIVITDCKVQLDIKIDKGIGIGCLEDNQDISVRNANINILCAGSNISAMGSVESTEGTIWVDSSEISILANGQQLYLMGAKEGKLDLIFNDSAINLRGEGNAVLAMGTGDKEATIDARKTICNIRVASGSPTVYGATPGNAVFEGGLQSVSVNE